MHKNQQKKKDKIKYHLRQTRDLLATLVVQGWRTN